jgi:hypothetical protein
MPRGTPVAAARRLALAPLALALLLLGPPRAAGAEPPNPYAEGATVVGVDGAPAGPSVGERL